MWISLTSLLRRLASIGNRCPPLIAKQYLTLFSRRIRPISAPPSSLAISNLLILPSPAPAARGCLSDGIIRCRSFGAILTLFLQSSKPAAAGGSWLGLFHPGSTPAVARLLTFDNRRRHVISVNESYRIPGRGRMSVDGGACARRLSLAKIQSVVLLTQ